MSEIKELERRLTAALDRIGAGVAHLGAVVSVTPDAEAAVPDTAPVPAVAETEQPPANAAADAARVAELEAKLLEEQAAKLQLEEQVRVLKDRQDGQIADMSQATEASKKQLVRFDRELQKLRQANAELRDINGKLRAVAEKSVSDPQLINRAMQAELEALRVERSAEATEVETILNELTPIIREAN